MASPIYRRVIVKISGEALAGPDGAPQADSSQAETADFGIAQATLERIAADLAATRELGVTLGVVVGGGNFVRGVHASKRGLPPLPAAPLRILPTLINAL